jgi:uncharacterized protein YraI
MAAGFTIAGIKAFWDHGLRVDRTIGRLAMIAVMAFCLNSLSAGAASAADAYTNTSVSMRAGPSSDYPRVTMLNAGTPVTIYGCLQDYTWCDTSFQNARGWVAAAYLTYPYQGNRVAIPAFGAQLGLAILNFSLNDYWGSYYRGRPWYGRRDYWGRHPARPEYVRPGRPHRPPVAHRPPPRPKPPAIRPPRPKPPVTKPPRPNPGPGNGTKPPRPKPDRPGGGNRPSPGPGQDNKPSRPTTLPAKPPPQ